jgi:integrase
MPRKSRRKGFNKRGRSEHAGVTIGLDESGGQPVIVLRWFDPAPAGHTGKRRKAIVYGLDGTPVSSREEAKPAAVKKSDELREEQARIDKGGQATNFDGTWDGLLNAHKKYLKAKGSSPKTITDYGQTWRFLDSWVGRPLAPQGLTVEHLRGFVAHVKGYVSKKTGKALAPHSVAATLRHVKALLNYGRKELACVRLDGEAINRGLQQGKLPRLLPVAHSSRELVDILDKAAVYDAEHPKSEIFPLLAFLMLTGCRRGEAEALRWSASASGAAESWVDFDGGRILIYGEKTGRQRSIPLANRPALRELLETLQDKADEKTEPFVFGGPLPLAIGDKRPTTKDGVIGRSLKAALESVQNTAKSNWKPKDLRSTFASYAANSVQGLNLYTLAGELGHDYAILTKHYAGHLTLPEARKSASTIEGMLGIEKPLASWFKATSGAKGRILKLKRA